ncbi:PP2C family serine/threonine-protein phosphatase [Arthrospira platensis NCB002]|uniref:PP2C family serine/threonine-protein phosphatase n=1 Tax=Limnospira platensis TaxID=118562 RepID=UPI002975DD02|nr:PP2C family serine/threonine-protein phosphatase [Arthrospira platensis NCB002]
MSNHDPNQEPDVEKLIKAICWKLDIENHSDELEKNELEKKWHDFQGSSDYQDTIEKIIKKIAGICAEIGQEFSEIKFEISSNKKSSEVAKLVETLVDFFIKKNQNCSQLTEKIKTAINEVFKNKSPQLPPLSEPNQTEFIRDSEVLSPTENVPLSTKNLSNDNINTSVNATSITPSINEAKTVGSANSPTPEATLLEHSTEGKIAQPESTSTPITPPWEYHRVPDEPKPHDEFYSQKSDQSPEGLKLIGARVRGKMHKHQGTNCDDWFKFDTVGKWTIIAVSDGAGSKKFSRIGAKISCEAAVKSLKEFLESFSLCETAKTDLENDFDRDSEWLFKGDKAKELQKSLYTALSKAYQRVEEEANRLKNYSSYNKREEKKELDIKDLSATLLLAIHTKIQVKNSTSYDFVLTCQVGDGMLAAISHKYTLKLLGKPDIGEHGGQTDFLTSAGKLEDYNLVQKTFPFIGNLKALMIMTDGVSDDYFPNDPGMLKLYGDLILNRVIKIRNVDAKEREQELQKNLS